MNELVGKICACIFDLHARDWPVPGSPAAVFIMAVDMPMVKLRSAHAAEDAKGLWVNASTIKFIGEH